MESFDSVKMKRKFQFLEKIQKNEKRKRKFDFRAEY